MMHRRDLLLAAIFLSACSKSGSGGGSGAGSGAFGLNQRVAVGGLAFPTGLPQPTALTARVAFPNLSFNQPLFLTSARDGTDRIFVVEKGGLIYVFPNDSTAPQAKVFLDLRSKVINTNELGLLGLAFHPSYATNGLFYVYYSVDPDWRSRISRFQVTADPDVADPASEAILLEFAQPYSNHNGGMLAFGPDGMLYIASGDGGSGGDPHNFGQSLTTPLGKILRISPSGAIPPDNPFVGRGGGVREEIWAYGLRNPWRFSFDRNTGTGWIGDVGQGNVEEVDILVKGGNYGWRLFEGDRTYENPTGLPASDFDAPVIAYDHSAGHSVTGGYVYRGSLLPAFYGAYFYGDYSSGRIWALVHDGTQLISNTEVANVTLPTSFGEDEAGEIYFCSFDGRIYRFEGGQSPAPSFPQTLSATGLFTSTPSLTAAPGLIEFEVNSPLWSDGARKRRWLALPGQTVIGFHATEAWTFPVGTVFVKHFEIDTSPGQTLRLETRVLLRHDAGWQGYTYRWNQAQTDADLLPDSATATFNVLDSSAPNNQRSQTWYFPSRTDCLFCHTSQAGRVLGARTRQLNGDFDYPSATDNQLRSWNHIGLFDADIGLPSSYQALADPLDASQPLAARARSYLDANCAQCHRPSGPTPVNLDLRYGIAVSDMNAVGVAPVSGTSQVPGSQRITAGNRQMSVIWELMGRAGSGRMPPLATSVIDDDGLDAIGDWIDAGAR